MHHTRCPITWIVVVVRDADTPLSEAVTGAADGKLEGSVATGGR